MGQVCCEWFQDRLCLVEQSNRLVPSSDLAVESGEPLVADAEGLPVAKDLGMVADQFLDHFARLLVRADGLGNPAHLVLQRGDPVDGVRPLRL